ncbi:MULTISPECIES: hypothetical protein [Vibrio]|jgi:hypothetical protein|uniref:hypothetical protein n=1 Tax=Vibrio TaxID=662 RepID=UPI00050C1C41|nr:MULTISPECIES: hypothetical protein [Vibrio]EGQ8535964.1 hypothetical protein [Vibrio parahaemolyticus]EGR3360984.1 hypothetical protein [Vibrio parahaemolyticus]ELC3210318.1 hypothetical protein [Vibrio parahaemolyticus]KAB5597022.1 hypothetical protein F0578_24115 [Vibrio parahaemolyticus]MBE3700973.1 hypothetical protein [Vibrio parahaemolyticus]
MELNKKKTGNRCGHDPQKPITKLVHEFTKQPAVLRTLAERIERFNRNRSVIPMLSASRNSKRTRRSESAESISLVLKCITKYIDLVTFKVGFFNRGKWFNLSYNKIQEHTGLSKFRVLRAMAEIQRVGLVGLHEIYEEITDQNGNVRKIAKVAVKTVNLALFAIFGMENTCVKERKKASNRRAKKEQKERDSAIASNRPDHLKGLKGIALAKATMQAAKHNAKKAAKRNKPHQISDEILIWDDGIPY